MIVAPRISRHFAAHRHGLVVGQGRGNFFQVEAHHAAHGHGGQRGVDVMAAPDRNGKPHRRCLLLPPRACRRGCRWPAPRFTAGHVEFQAALLALDIHRAQVALRPGADPGDRRRTARRHSSQPRIVGQHGMSAGGQRGQQLGLGLGHALAIAESAEMGVAKLRDHAHLGRAQLGQHGDLAGTAGRPIPARHSRVAVRWSTCSTGTPH